MSFVHSVKVHVKCPSSKVKFGNGNHSFSSWLNYFITVTVPLLTDVGTMQIENNYKCSVVQRPGCELNKLCYDSHQREEICSLHLKHLDQFCDPPPAS